MFRRFAKLTLSLCVSLSDRLGASRPGQGVVLYYHAVPALARKWFAEQMDILAESAQPWSLDRSPPRADRWVGISFDDAYVSVLENAVPELEKHRLPFTIFVPTGCLGRRPCWVRSPDHPFWNERVMSAEQLRILARMPGVTLGSHTVTHPRLTRLGPEDLKRELSDSRVALEDLIQRPVELLSFPHGDWSETVLRTAEAIGYRRFFGIEPTCLNGGPLPPVVGRVAVEPTDSPLEFRMKVRGCYRWAVKRRHPTPCF